MKRFIFIIFVLIQLNARSQSTELFFQFENFSFESFDTVKAKARVFGFEDIVGFQLGLRYDTNYLRLIGVELPNPTPIPMANLGDSIFVDLTDTLLIPDCILGDFGFCTEGEIKIVWNNAYPKTAVDSSELFAFYFLAKSPGELKNTLELDPSILYNVAYIFTNQQIQIPLNLTFFNQLSISDVYELQSEIQIYPNPYFNSVNIYFEGTHSYLVYNSIGQLIEQGMFTDKLNFEGSKPGTYFIKVENQTFQMFKL